MSPQFLFKTGYKPLFIALAISAALLMLLSSKISTLAIACDPEDPECLNCSESALLDKGFEDFDDVNVISESGSLTGTGIYILKHETIYVESGTIVYRATTTIDDRSLWVSDITDGESAIFSCDYDTKNITLSSYEYMPLTSYSCEWEAGPTGEDIFLTKHRSYEYIIDLINGVWPWGEIPGTYTTSRIAESYYDHVDTPVSEDIEVNDLVSHSYQVNIPEPHAWTGSEMPLVYAFEMFERRNNDQEIFEYDHIDIDSGTGVFLSDSCLFGPGSGNLLYEDTCTITEDPQDPGYQDHVDNQEILEEQLFGSGRLLEPGVFNTHDACEAKLNDYIEYLQNEVFTEGPQP